MENHWWTAFEILIFKNKTKQKYWFSNLTVQGNFWGHCEKCQSWACDSKGIWSIGLRRSLGICILFKCRGLWFTSKKYCICSCPRYTLSPRTQEITQGCCLEISPEWSPKAYHFITFNRSFSRLHLPSAVITSEENMSLDFRSQALCPVKVSSIFPLLWPIPTASYKVRTSPLFCGFPKCPKTK